MRKFFAHVTGIGDFAQEFIDEGVLVFFADSAPEELQEHAVVHDDEAPLHDDVAVGDKIRIGSVKLPILAVGKVANENFRNLGHLVLKFNGLSEPEMDGDVCVPEVVAPDIKPGMELEVMRD